MDARLEQVRWAFYQWLGALSIDEIMSNEALMERAQQVEWLLKKFSV